MVGILISFWDGLFLGAMLVLGSVYNVFYASPVVWKFHQQSKQAMVLLMEEILHQLINRLCSFSYDLQGVYRS